MALSLYALLRSQRRDWVAGSETEIVIEGFPRSGNTFAVVAFRQAQAGRERKIAHHLHAPAQLLTAVRYGVPHMLLLRSPTEACASLMLREPWIDVRSALWAYCLFHEALKPIRTEIFVAPFSDVISDYGIVLTRLNERFGTDFGVFEHTDKNVALCFEELDRLDDRDRARWHGPGLPQSEDTVARPSEGRKARAEAVRQTIESPHFTELLRRATRLHVELVQLSRCQGRPASPPETSVRVRC